MIRQATAASNPDRLARQWPKRFGRDFRTALLVSAGAAAGTRPPLSDAFAAVERGGHPEIMAAIGARILGVTAAKPFRPEALSDGRPA